MGEKTFNLIPKEVTPVNTRYRRIHTKIPVPESIEILEKLQKFEPHSMSGQPPVIWNIASGVNVYDKWGNIWLDFSSGVLVTNTGHCAQEIKEAIIKQAKKGLIHNYCFPSEIRATLAEKLISITPPELDKVFFLTTGSEVAENAIKLARTYGQQRFGKEKICIVSFDKAFHGRTLGAQMIGGIPVLKEWIVNLDKDMVQVPFPDGFRTKDTSFGLFVKSLEELNIKPSRVAGVILETYQGGNASFAPKEYIQQLSRWCKENNTLLIFDEIQAAFGRTGTMFGFEHYDVIPDIMCLGKGITSSLPLSAVIGKAEIMNIFPPGEMTSTHSGNPICCAASIANIDKILRENLVENAKNMGNVLFEGLNKLKNKYDSVIGVVHGKGLVAGVQLIKPGGIEPNGDLAFDVISRCVEKGLLFFAPVGFGGATIKICPPIVITEEAIMEGLQVIDEAFEEVLSGRGE